MAELIGFDGLDGSGKTTAAKALAGITGSSYMYFSDDNILKQLRGDADQLPLDERFAFYLSMNIMNHPRLEKLKAANNRAIILDRTPLSTFAYHEVMGVDLNPYTSLKDYLLSQFDAICYLFASPESLRARLISRSGDAGMQQFDEFSLKFQSEIHKAFLSILPSSAIIIDTSSLSVDLVVSEAKLTLTDSFKYE